MRADGVVLVDPGVQDDPGLEHAAEELALSTSSRAYVERFNGTMFCCGEPLAMNNCPTCWDRSARLYRRVLGDLTDRGAVPAPERGFRQEPLCG